MDYKMLLDQFALKHDVRGWPRQRVLHACLRHAILDGALPAGSRLLASRALADDLGIARNTVLYAYDQLVTEGLAHSTPRGTAVAAFAPAARPAPAPAQPDGAAIARRMQGVRAMAAADSQVRAFAPGVPALDAFPLAAWRRVLERAWRDVAPGQLDYPDAAGLPVLRAEISAYLRAARGVVCTPEQVFVTSGTQSSLDICARCLADAGDTAWLENPGYQGAAAAFRAAQLRTVGIGVDDGGIAPSARDWRVAPPRLIYLTPSHQYPTGSVLDMPRRMALIERARAAGALLIEDDYDSEFRYDGPPLAAMQGLAADAPVIYLGTFSKTMFPALRTAFMVVPPRLAAPLRAVLARAAPHGRSVDQLAVAAFLHSGQFGLHVRRMRRLYRSRRDALIAALARHLPADVTLHGASAGIHLALRFEDPRLPDAAVAAAAADQGITVRALSAHANGLKVTPWNGLMLGYAQVEADAMDALAARLAAVIAHCRAELPLI